MQTIEIIIFNSVQKSHNLRTTAFEPPSSIYMTALYEELRKSGKKLEKVRKSEMHLSS